MKRHFTFKIPVTFDMSPITYVVHGSAMETPKQEALWHYNKSREHDGLPPVSELPSGTRIKADL